jgi:biopolymer transport protein ExbD
MHFFGREESEARFQIAPMIDIVFILLVFFVATYAVQQHERLLDIELPEASEGADPKRSMRDIVVDLNAEGRIFLYRRERSPAYLEQRLRTLTEFADASGGNPGVIIRADGACDHRHVVRVMDICRHARVRRVFFSTLSQEEMDGADVE